MNRKNDRPRRRVKWLSLPRRLQDIAIARALAGPQRGNVRVIDLATARQQRAPRDERGRRHYAHGENRRIDRQWRKEGH